MVLIQEIHEDVTVQSIDNLPKDADMKDANEKTPIKLHIRVRSISDSVFMKKDYGPGDGERRFPSVLEYSMLPLDEKDEHLFVMKNLSYGLDTNGLGPYQNFSGCMDAPVNVIAQTFNAINYLLMTLADNSRAAQTTTKKILADVHTIRALIILQKAKHEPAFVVSEEGHILWFEAIVKENSIRNAVSSIPDTKLLMEKVRQAALFVVKDISLGTGVSPSEIPIETIIHRCNVAMVQKEVKSMLNSSANLFAPKEDKMEDPDEIAELNKSFIQLVVESETTGKPVHVKIETGEMTELNGNKVQNPNAEPATFTV